MSLLVSLPVTIICATSVTVFILKLVVNFIKDVRNAPNVVYYSEQERCYYDPIKQDIHLFPTAMLTDMNHQGLIIERERLTRSTEAIEKSSTIKPNELKQIEKEFENNNKTRQQDEHIRRNRERVDLSVIVPAYNEEERLPHMLDQTIEFLEDRRKKYQSGAEDEVGDLYNKKDFTYEIIIVDDGSSDKTSNVGLRYSAKFTTDKVRVLSLARNRGKGGAVRLGVLASRGKYILFADADGASEFGEISKLEKFLLDIQRKQANMSKQHEQLDKRLHMVIGSRAHLEKNAIAERSLFRTVLMKGFHFLVWTTCVRSVHDTQCGFKLFNRPAARVLFNSYHNESWAFDVELLYLAEQIGCDIGEVSIHWNEISGSKIVPVLSWLRMGFDIVCIALYYFLGIYKVPNEIQVRLESAEDSQ